MHIFKIKKDEEKKGNADAPSLFPLCCEIFFSKISFTS